MATQSIYKQVHIRDKSLARQLIVALENSQQVKAPSEQYTKTVREIKDSDTIRSIFNK